MKKLYLVVPCFNEEQIIDSTIDTLTHKLTQLIESNMISKESKILLVDDGSTDSTWEKIETKSNSNIYLSALKLSKNRGHQNALYAGLMESLNDAEITISLDADLQDDIECFDKMIEEYKKGSEIVFGVRNDRSSDTLFKKYTAHLFYQFMQFLGVKIILNHADFRLMSHRSIEMLSKYSESNLFLRGIIPDIGLKTSKVYYKRLERKAGESKYPLRKMVNFAWNGITSFSIRPLRIITNLGLLLFIISLGTIIYSVIRYFEGNTVTGWAFLNVSIWLLSGLQLLALGIVGEYIGNIYSETKRRPKYFIEKQI